MLSLAAVKSCPNRALYITSVGWVNSLNLGVVLVNLSLSPPIGYASSHHGASVDAYCVTEMSQFIESMIPTFSHNFTYSLVRRKLNPELTIP